MVDENAENGIVTIQKALEDVLTVGRKLKVPIERASDEVVSAEIVHIVNITDDNRILAIVTSANESDEPFCIQLSDNGQQTRISVAEAISVISRPISEVLAVNAEVTFPLVPLPNVNDDAANRLTAQGTVVIIPNGENGVINSNFGVGSFGRRFTAAGSNTVISIPTSRQKEKVEK